jgi:endonuclease YncB( thermonuclease family)
MRLSLLLVPCLLAPVSALADCPPAGGLPPIRAEMRSATELRLGDGRTVRLAGLTVPQAVAADARQALSGLVGEDVTIVPVRTEPDRYGRTSARVRSGERWVEAELVRAGLALPNLYPGETDCAAELIAAEREARTARRGVWSAEPGPILAPDDRTALQRTRGRFVLVSGTISSVGVRDYATFLNFGRRWTDAVAVVIRRSDRASVEAVHGSLNALNGRRVLIRGVLEPGEAPRIAVTRPEAIELLD